jgi:hypothetical protein
MQKGINEKPYYTNCIFAEYFDNQKTVADNRGLVTGTPTINNGAVFGENQFITYASSALLAKMQACVLGGTIIVKFRVDDDGANERILGSDHTSAGDYEFRLQRTGVGSSNITVAMGNRSSATTVICGTAGLNQTAVASFSWANSGGISTIQGYINGVAGTSTTANHVVVMPNRGLEVANWGTNDFIGKIFWVEIYNKVLSPEEIKDRYEEDTYNGIDLIRDSDVYFPLQTAYVDATGTMVTPNLGSLGGAITVGNGSTSTSYPILIAPNKAFFATSAMYFRSVNFYTPELGKDFTIGLIHQGIDNSAGVTHRLVDIGTYSTDGIMISQFGPRVNVYWNGSSPAVTTALGSYSFGNRTSIIVSCVAGITTIYQNGVSMATADLSAKTGVTAIKNLLFGSVTAAQTIRGTIESPFIMRKGITHAQARYLDYLLKAAK